MDECFYKDTSSSRILSKRGMILSDSFYGEGYDDFIVEGFENKDEFLNCILSFTIKEEYNPVEIFELTKCIKYLTFFVSESKESLIYSFFPAVFYEYIEELFYLTNEKEILYIIIAFYAQISYKIQVEIRSMRDFTGKLFLLYNDDNKNLDQIGILCIIGNLLSEKKCVEALTIDGWVDFLSSISNSEFSVWILSLILSIQIPKKYVSFMVERALFAFISNEDNESVVRNSFFCLNNLLEIVNIDTIDSILQLFPEHIVVKIVTYANYEIVSEFVFHILLFLVQNNHHFDRVLDDIGLTQMEMILKSVPGFSVKIHVLQFLFDCISREFWEISLHMFSIIYDLFIEGTYHEKIWSLAIISKSFLYLDSHVNGNHNAILNYIPEDFIQISLDLLLEQSVPLTLVESILDGFSTLFFRNDRFSQYLKENYSIIVDMESILYNPLYQDSIVIKESIKSIALL